jgi:hypothetical protein
MKLEFSRQVLEEYSTMKISRKSAQWEPSSIWADGQTDKMKRLIIAFRNFANTPNREKLTRENYEVFTNIIGRSHQDVWHDRNQAVREFKKKTERRSFFGNQGPNNKIKRVLDFKNFEISS